MIPCICSSVDTAEAPLAVASVRVEVFDDRADVDGLRLRSASVHCRHPEGGDGARTDSRRVQSLGIADASECVRVYSRL